MKKIPVRLTDLELWAIWKLAEERNGKKEKHGVATKKIDRQVSDLEMHYIGIKAEYAVSKLIGTDFNPTNMLAGDDGSDFVYRGLTVDVKFSQFDLKFRIGTFKSDIAILVQPLCGGIHKYGVQKIGAERDDRIKKVEFAWRNVLVIGWVSREEFSKKHIIRNFGYNDVEFMRATSLRPMWRLKDYAKQTSRLA